MNEENEELYCGFCGKPLDREEDKWRVFIDTALECPRCYAVNKIENSEIVWFGEM